jgi:tape measure domain-containing protein
MATDVERLVAVMEVNARKYERDMARLTAQTDRQTRDIERRFRDTNKSLEDGFSGAGLAARGLASAIAPLGAAIAGAFSVQSILQAADAFTRTQNALKVAGLEGAELAKVYNDLFAIAQKQGAPIEQLSRLYGQLSQAQADLKVSSQDILTVVDATGAALRVSGVPAAQASGAILGLSQALSGGTVRAEEFNQMLEGGLRPALQAAANQITEAGGSVGKLRQLVTEGEVSSRLFFEAIKRGTPALGDLADKAGVTTSQALNRLWNEMINLAGELDKATGASSALASGINGVASAARALADSIGPAIRRLQEYAAAARQAINAGTLLNASQRGMDAGAMLGGQKPVNGTFDAGRFEMSGAQGNLPTARADRLRQMLTRSDATLSVSDPRFRNEEKDSGGGGGGGRSAAERVSDYEREVEALNKRRAAIELDIATFGRSAEAISRAKVEQQLLNALQKDGVVASEEQRAKVSELAQAFTETEAKLKSMKDAQEAANEIARFAGQSISSYFSDVLSGGKNAEKAVMNLTKRLSEMALQAVLLGDGPLAKLFGLGGSGGILGGLFKGLLPGRSLGGRVMAGQPYTVGENGRETFVPTQNGRIINARQAAAGGKPSVTIVQNISANGDRTVAEIARRAAAEGISSYDRSLPSRISSMNTRAG